MDKPFSLREAAIGLHEMLLAFMEAGFTREEALALVVVHLRIGAEKGGR